MLLPLAILVQTVQPCLQKLLENSALDLLTDSSWTSLDLSDSIITDSAVQTALGRTPQLLSLDLTGCKVSQQTIRLLGSWCPQLQVLRIGWFVVSCLLLVSQEHCCPACSAAVQVPKMCLRAMSGQLA